MGFGLASGLVCSTLLVFAFDVFARLHIYLITIKGFEMVLCYLAIAMLLSKLKNLILFYSLDVRLHAVG